jgi:hypothetical protein
MPRPPACSTAIARSRVPTPPSTASWKGSRHPASSVNRVRTAASGHGSYRPAVPRRGNPGGTGGDGLSRRHGEPLGEARRLVPPSR